jgi:hypothetical protein
MNREPCRIDDDPSYDYSDYEESKGYYKEKPEPNPDDAYDDWRAQNPRKETTPAAGSLDSLL